MSLFIFFIGFLSQVSCMNECLKNLEILELSGSEAHLSWTYSCVNQNIKKYKVHFTHKRFLACPDDRRDDGRPSGIGTVEVEDKTRVIIHNLHAYSEYEFEVVAVFSNSNKPEILKVISNTLEGNPEVRALKSSNDYYSYKDTSSKVVFDWSKPKQSQCELYNSDLGGWEYKVEGLDQWNKQFMINGRLDISQTKLEVDSLLPYSRYMLQLYTANTAGLYDENVVLKIPKSTKQSTPVPPTHLQTLQHSPGPGSVVLLWTDAFPPTGETSSYRIRWKDGDTSPWMEQIEVLKNDTACDDTKHEADESVCYILNNLEENKNYSFQVQSYNSGVSQGSGWSNATIHVTQSSSETPTTSHIFIVLACLPLIVILATICIVRYKRRHSSVSKVFKSVPADIQDPELLIPIIRNSTPRQSNLSDVSVTLPRQSCPVPGTPRHFTTLPLHRPRSGCDPLPPLPTQGDHAYEPMDRKKTYRFHDDEDDYLAPNTVRVESVESLDEEGYLRPNFVPS